MRGLPSREQRDSLGKLEKDLGPMRLLLRGPMQTLGGTASQSSDYF